MGSYSDTVREALSQQDNADLLSKVRFGGLTVEAHSVALSVLASRGIDTTILPDRPISEFPTKNHHQSTPANEKLNWRYRIYCSLSMGLVLWGWGIGVAAMEAAQRQGYLGIVKGLLVLLFIGMPPFIVSLRAWSFASSSKEISNFIGQHWLRIWISTGIAGAVGILFSVYGVFVEAMRTT